MIEFFISAFLFILHLKTFCLMLLYLLKTFFKQKRLIKQANILLNLSFFDARTFQNLQLFIFLKYSSYAERLLQGLRTLIITIPEKCFNRRHFILKRSSVRMSKTFPYTINPLSKNPFAYLGFAAMYFKRCVYKCNCLSSKLFEI